MFRRSSQLAVCFLLLNASHCLRPCDPRSQIPPPWASQLVKKGVDAAEYAVQGFAFQCLSSRLGIATGLNLAQHCGQEYPKLPRYLMWFCMEIAIIGADIQEVIGSAIAIALLSNNVIPLWAGVHAVSLYPFEPGGMLYLLQHGTAVWLYGLQCLPCFG